MTKQELEKAIENGESVWLIAPDNKEQQIFEIKLNGDIVMYDTFFTIDFEDKERELYTFDRLYITKSQAEHYLKHANISRIETLPFLTWEEFKKGKDVLFYNNTGWYQLYLECSKIVLSAKGYLHSRWELTEKNFYKAYDECVKLFRGEV